MPHHKSCKKRMRTSEISRTQNRAYRSQVRSLVRQVQTAETQAAASESLIKATTLLDRLARKGVIKKNSAANTKSKLQRHFNKLPAEA